MSDTFPRLLAEVRALNHAVLGECRPEWGARYPGSRVSIRLAMRGALPALDPADLVDLADMSEPPRPSRWSVSVSHTHDLGGWLAVPRPAQIGWDVELEARIKLSTIERVCSKDELELAPEAAFLWCAKEAFFKALEDEQPAAIPQLTIGDWTAHGVSMWRWRGLGPRNGEGILIRDGGWLIAASVIA